MSARDDAINTIKRICPSHLDAEYYGAVLAERFDAYRAEVLHEAAEKIRADILPEEQLVYREQQAEADGIRHAADLIDPEAS